MLCITVINLLNKGTICLTQKMKLCFPVLWLRWISHVEWKTALTGEKQRKCLFERWASAPRPLLHLLPYTFFFSPFFSLFLPPPSDPLPEHTSALRQQWGTDKPALMKMNVPTWSPIEFHYEVYLSGAGSQAPGSVLLGSLQACCGETPAQANLSGAALPQPGPRREKWNDSLAFCHFLSVPFCCLSPLLHGLSYQTEKPLAVAVLLSPFCLDVHLSVTSCVSVILAPAHHQKKEGMRNRSTSRASFIRPHYEFYADQLLNSLGELCIS